MQSLIEIRQSTAVSIAALLKARQQHPEQWEGYEELDDILEQLSAVDQKLTVELRRAARETA